MEGNLLGGGQDTPIQDNNTPQDTPQDNNTPQGNDETPNNNTQVNWTQLLGEYAEDPSIQKFKDPKDLAKSYLELQSLIGKKKIPIPDKPDEFPNVLKQLGMPEDPNGYPDFDDAEKVFGSKEDWEEFKQVAYESGLLPYQFEKLYSKVKEIISTTEQMTQQQRQEIMQQAVQQLQQKFGDEFQAKLNLANRLFAQMPQDVQQAIYEAGLDVNPNFVEFLAKLGEYYKEDSFEVSGYSTADAKEELNKIYSNPQHPFFNKEHPEHEAAVKKVEKLYKIIYG